jgi:hypothetical protein
MTQLLNFKAWTVFVDASVKRIESSHFMRKNALYLHGTDPRSQFSAEILFYYMKA